MPAKVAPKKGEKKATGAAAKPKASTGAAKASTSGGKPTAKAAAASSKKTAGKPPAEKDVSDKLAKLSTDDPPKPTVIDVAFKDLATALKDDDEKIKATGKWPLLVDPTGKAAVFFRYQGGNFLDTINPADMQPEPIRRLLLGSLRYAKYFIVDFGDTDMFDACAMKFDEAQKGLLDDVIDQSILEKFAYLIRDSDGPDYEESKFLPHLMTEFRFIVLSKIEPAPRLSDKFCVMRIKME